jgi:hypothetical protein
MVKLTTKIADWYKENYPSDDMGDDLNNNESFADLYDCLNAKEDVYILFGVSDSVIRERLFSELSNILNVEYDHLYKMWLEE